MRAALRKHFRRTRLWVEQLEDRILLTAPLNDFAQFSGTLAGAGDTARIPVVLSPADFSIPSGKAVLGLRVEAAPGSTLDPAAAVITTAAGTSVAPWSTSPDLANGGQSLTLASLAYGSYVVSVASEHGTAGAFVLHVYVAGDANGDHRIDVTDGTIIHSLIGVSAGDPRYLTAADANFDGFISSIDYTLWRNNLSVATPIAPLTLSIQTPPGLVTLPSGALATAGAAVTLRGTTEPGATVALGSSSTTADGIGNFSLNVTLASGANNLQVSASDAFGQHQTAGLSILLDTQAPMVTVSSPAPGLATLANITIAGQTADDLTGVATLKASVDGAPYAPLTFDALGNFSDVTALALNGSADGSHTVAFVATDRVGNVSSPVSYTFTLDTVAPQVAVTSPPANLITNQNVTVAGQVIDDRSGVASLQGALDNNTFAPVTLGTGGSFSFPTNLPMDHSADGPHTEHLKATDNAGNVSLFDIFFTLDTTPSVITVTSPTTNVLTNQNTTITGNVADALSGVASLQEAVDSTSGPFASVTLLPNGGFSFPTTLKTDGSADGPHTIYLQAIDDAGNVSSFFDVFVTLDTTPPVITVTSPAPGQTVNQNVAVTGQATDALSGVASVEAALDGGTFAPLTLDAGGHFSLTTSIALDGSADGPHTVHLQATDQAGNVSKTDVAFTLQTASLLPTGYLLQTGTTFEATHEQQITIPSQPSALMFNYADLSFAPSSQGQVQDTFEVALVDAAGNSLVPTIAADRDAFSNITAKQHAALGAWATSGGQTVTLDVSNVTPSTVATLIFRLVNNNSATNNSVRVFNAQVIPLTGQPVGPGGQPATGFAASPATIDFTQLGDVSASFQPVYGRTSFDEGTNVLYADLAVQNAGQYPVDTPLVVAIDHLSDPNVRVRGADGVTPDGTPYYDFSSHVTGGTLAAGETTGSRTVSFYNPDGGQFTYDLVFLGLLNRPPVFTSSPNLEALVGKPYTYAAQATDPNGHPLTYSLVTAPMAMTINGQTGVISWAPQVGDVGNQSVTVRADDGNGRIAQQSYTLGVIQPPPDRPPVFTSTPVVDANVNTAYAYQSTATDADQDPLTFALTSGPQGMTVDGASGLVRWQPTAAQLGLQNVVLTVSDGRGGSATQTYTVDVQQQSGNQPPEITSNAVTAAVTGLAYSYPVRVIDSDDDTLTYSLTTAPAEMLIDPSSGLIQWTPLTTQTGSQSVVVRVDDGRGGYDTQSFTLNVTTEQPGSIQGTVFNDVNGDGSQDLIGDNSAPVPLLNVPGTADLYLAGMPDGTTASGGDLAPAQSPFLVPGLTLTAGEALMVSVPAGAVNLQNGVGNPDGGGSPFTDHAAGAENGISDLVVPGNALIGVFLGPDQPDSSFAPSPLDFSSGGNVTDGINYTTLMPELQQAFFIGDGRTHSGEIQQIVVPAGATRLYLGVMSGGTVAGNRGSLGVAVQPYDPANAPPSFSPVTAATNSSTTYSLIDYKPDESLLLADASGGLKQINPDGTSSPFISPGLSYGGGEGYLATALPGNLGGFTPGDVFLLPSTRFLNVLRITDGGRTVNYSWVGTDVNGSGGEGGAITFDQTGVFGGDLIVALSTGAVYRIDANGDASLIAQIGHYDSVEGITVLPNDSAHYGPLAGCIIVGVWDSGSFAGDPLQSGFSAISASGVVTFYSLDNSLAPLSPGAYPAFFTETIGVVQPNDNLYTDGPISNNGYVQQILGTPYSEIKTFTGDILVSTEFGLLFRIFWEGQSLQAQVIPYPTSLATEAFAFSTSGIGPLPAVPFEPGLANWTVYLDLNHDGKLDPGDPTTTTDAEGNYSFSNLAPGTYTVAEVGQPGWQQTAPTGGTYAAVVESGQVITAPDFGNQQLPTAPPRPPAITSKAPATGTVGERYSYSVLVSNPDGVSLQFDLPVKPAGMVVDPMTGVVAWTPTADEVGTQNVVLRLRDARGDVVLQQFQIAITVNQPPLITSNPVTQYNIPPASNPPSGPVHPTGLQLTLGAGQTSTQTVSLAVGLPGAQRQRGVFNVGDVFFADAYNSKVVQFDNNLNLINDLPVSTYQPSGLAFDSAGNLDVGEWLYGGGTRVFRFDDTGTPNPGETFAQADSAGIESITADMAGDIYVGSGNSPEVTEISPTGTVLDHFTVYSDLRGASFLDLSSDQRTLYYTSEGISIHRYDVVDHAQSPDFASVPQAILASAPNAILGDLRLLPDGGVLVSSDRTNQVLRFDRNGNLVQTYSVYLPGYMALDSDGTSFWVSSGASSVVQYDQLSRIDIASGRVLVSTALGGTDNVFGLAVFGEPRAGTGFGTGPIEVVSSDPSVMVSNLSGPVIGSPGTSVSFDVKFTGDGNTHSFDLLFERAGTAAILGSIPVIMTAPYEYQVHAVDADGDPLVYSLVQAPVGASIDAQTGEIQWNPPQAGKYPFDVRVDDGRGGFDTQNYSLLVVHDPNNQSPTISSTPHTVVGLGQTYRYAVQATDLDGDPLTYSLTLAPPGMTIDASGLITWNPTAGQFGANSVAVHVDDGRGGTVDQSFSVQVVTQQSNHPPSIISTPPLVDLRAGSLYAYNATGNDPDSTALVWSLDAAPAGMAIDPARGTLVWCPTADELGTAIVVLRLTNGEGLSVTQRFTVTVRAVSLPPVITSEPLTEIGVGQAYSYAVQANDVDGDSLTYTLTAGPKGMTIDPNTGLVQWTPTAAEVGTQSATIMVDDGKGGVAGQSWNVVVTSTAMLMPPTITSAPAEAATVGQAYAYHVTATDPQGQPLTYSLGQTPVGITIDPASGLVQWTPDAAQTGTQTVQVIATDQAGLAAGQTFGVRVLVNTPPVINSSPPTAITAALAYRYDVNATDPDGDPLTYTLTTGPAGMTLDSLGRLRWSPGIPEIGIAPVSLTVADDHGASVSQSFDVTVLADTQTPQVALSVSTNPVDIGSSDTFIVTAVDNVKVQALTLSVNGTPVALDVNGRATLTMKTPGDVAVVATATDLAGNTGTASATVTVIDPSVTNPPTVSFDTPDDGAAITAPTDVIGTVSDTSLLYYTLSIAPVGSDSFTEIARGTSPVTDGVLGRFDPSLLANDSYDLRLYAKNAGGLDSTIDETVNVAGGLKLGNFKLSFTDLSIPVAGLPITVTRTYDSLNANTSQDFGYGWSLEFRDTNLQTSVPSTGDEADGVYNPFSDGTRVDVTLPGGTREVFTFHPALAPGLAGSLLGIYAPSFTPDAGVTDQLTVPNFSLQVNDDGTVSSYGGDLPYNPADTAFDGYYVLTTKDGVAYQIDGNTGKLNTVSDNNGNTLTFSDSGIVSSAGPQVTFTRDPQGRITAVTDPAGNKVTYQYDAGGNLTAVTDRVGNTTQFVYGAAQPHYLTKVIDPLGNTGIRTNYDAQGRLIAETDAAGNAVQLSYDPTHSIETVKDQLGNPTTYEYDDRGNIVKEVDALGGVTARTYDASNNMLSETDPLGRTTSYTYDSLANTLTETDALGHVTQFTYQTIQRHTSIGAALAPFTVQATTTDALGDTTTNSYDASGNLLSTTDPSGAVTSFTYDASGNPASLTDANGNATALVYDGAGHLVSQTDALGDVTTYAYDANGNETKQSKTLTTPAGVRTLVTTTEYDAAGRVTKVTDPEGNVTSTQYDAAGNRTASIDALGHKTQYAYDNRGELTKTTYADGTTTQSEYDADGHVTATIDQLGRRTEMKYHALGRLVETDYPDNTLNDPTDNPRTKTEYDAAGEVTAQVDERGNRTTFQFDAAGNQTLATDALGGKTTSTYDAANRLVAEKDALGHTTSFVLDATGRTVETDYADGTKSTVTLDAGGRVTARTDQAGATTHYQYDALGRLTAVVDALNQRTAYTYDEAGDLVTQTDANGHVTKYEYDGLGRRTATVLPMGQRSSTTYDADGNVVSATDFDGNTIQYQYDAMNRLTAKLFPDGTSTTFTYTADGQRATVTDARGVTQYACDARDRLVSRTDPDGTMISYTYDAAGDRTSVTTPAGTTSYTFDVLNRIATVTDPGAGVTQYTYDADGDLTNTTMPNGTSEKRTYDALNRLVYLENDGPAGIISSYSYTLGADGNRTKVVEDTGRTVNYAYDTLFRLIGESITDSVNGNRTIAYTYDPVGNRITRTDSAEGVTTDTYDANDRLMLESLAGVQTQYTYDANGNTLSQVTSPTNQSVYHWDFENRMIGADVTSTTGTSHTTYQYDADGIRIAATTDSVQTRYLIDTVQPYAQVLMEYRPSGLVVASYVYGNSLILQNRGGVVSYYQKDGLGSTRALTNASGVVTDRYVYDAFGRMIAQTGSTVNSYLFAGQQRDAGTGLDYLRARYLQPRLGRFFGRDPLTGFLTRPFTQNPYLYAAANPTNFIDPSGRQTDLAEIAVVLEANPILVSAEYSLVFGGLRILAVELVSHFVLEPAYKAYSIGLDLVASDEGLRSGAGEAIEGDEIAGAAMQTIAFGYSLLAETFSAISQAETLTAYGLGGASGAARLLASRGNPGRSFPVEISEALNRAGRIAHHFEGDPSSVFRQIIEAVTLLRGGL